MPENNDIRMVVVLDKIYTPERIGALHDARVSIVEVRGDLISDDTSVLSGYMETIRSLGRFDILLTIRESRTNKTKRPELFQILIDQADYVDMDISDPLCDAVARLTKKRKKRLVLSHHDFVTMPGEEDLQALLKKAKPYLPDVLKLAVTTNKKEELKRLLFFSQSVSNEYFVFMGMGRWGKLSRLIAPFFGSRWVYASMDEPVVPGQFQINALSRCLSELYGD